VIRLANKCGACVPWRARSSNSYRLQEDAAAYPYDFGLGGWASVSARLSGLWPRHRHLIRRRADGGSQLPASADGHRDRRTPPVLLAVSCLLPDGSGGTELWANLATFLSLQH
jgi:hypothetical protein